ncbi:MAG: ASPIC/UnbV domain-containing protein [Pirellulales bacterium]
MQGDWLQLELAGTRDNRDAIGAVVTVITQHGSWVQMVHAGRGYQSHFGNVLHFGLGPNARLKHIEVRWPSGQKQIFRDHSLNTRHLLIQELLKAP